MKSKSLYAIIFGLILFASCDQGNFYDVNKPIDNREWSYANLAKFAVEIADPNSKYDIYIQIRHTPEYNYSNLFVLLHQSGKSLKDTAYRHEISLAELDGRWLGKSAGNLFSKEILAKENFTFPDSGRYNFAIEQNMRDNPLKNISDVGLKIVKK